MLSSLAMTDSSSVKGQFLSSSSPPVMPAATKKVPASMRSAMMAYSVPRRLLTPLMRMVLLPWPSICAPQEMRKLARSTTSGSRAAFSSVVSPSASTAAMSRFSVPPTVGMSKVMWAPRSLSQWPMM